MLLAGRQFEAAALASDPNVLTIFADHHPLLGYTPDARGRKRPRSSPRLNAPSLLYLKYTQKFHYAIEDDDVPVPAPFGGLFWDGRVDTITELARQPLLNPDEMNNHDGKSVAAKIRKAAYAADFERELGASTDAARTLTNVGQAVEAFLTTDDMAPSSRR